MVSDQQLIQLAEVFVRAFQAALVESDEVFRTLLKEPGKGFSIGAHGTVEFTEELLDASRNLSARAVKVFGANRIHQKSVEEVARSIAFSTGDADTVKEIAKAIAAGIGEAANTKYRIIRPNTLIRAMDGVDEVKIGPVRIAKRESIRQDVEHSSSSIRISPIGSEKGAFSLIEDGAALHAHIHLPELCWDVSVQGMTRGLELQALWFIDVAISFIRLHYEKPRGLFPKLADVEPHPLYPHPNQSHGLSIGPAGAAFGGGTTAPWYELDADVIAILNSAKVIGVAEQVFDPKSNTLSERMQQALGWLTRARRAQEPAERVLLFFTTIEALLSGASKDGPVTETISRYAGVIWSDKPETRLALYKTLKKHYDLRSRIVHNGERSVAQIEVNNVHYIAWTITQILLRRADLTVKHVDFIETLKAASFGTKLEI
jgi:hypothetical protein